MMPVAISSFERVSGVASPLDSTSFARGAVVRAITIGRDRLERERGPAAEPAHADAVPGPSQVPGRRVDIGVAVDPNAPRGGGETRHREPVKPCTDGVRVEDRVLELD